MNIKPKRILMLALCPYPSPLGTAVCIRALAQELAALGHRLDVVTYASKKHSGSWSDGLVHTHAVPEAVVVQRSGPQNSKWRADARLWRYARRLGHTTSFDAIWGHHVEGIVLGRALQGVIRRPLIGHVHTRLGLELATYWTGSLQRMLGAAAGRLLDTVLPHLPNAMVALNAADAATMRRVAPKGQVFVRYPQLMRPAPPDLQQLTPMTSAYPRAPFAIYSGNADAYQNLELLCAAATSGGWPLMIATHGPISAFAGHAWPSNTQFVRVDSFAQMHAWLQGAHLGLCPRLQACGYPIKWLNYWHAGLTLVAADAVGRAVFGNALGSAVHGPALWTAATPQAFDRAVRQGLAKVATRSCAEPKYVWSLNSILAAAADHYATRRL